MPLRLVLLGSQVFSMVSNVFSKPSLFQILYIHYIHFLVGLFSEDTVMSQQKRKAAHPRIKQYFCSKLKQKFLAVNHPVSANASSRACKNSF